MIPPHACQRCDRDAFYIEVRPWIEAPRRIPRDVHVVCTRCAQRLNFEMPLGYRFKLADWEHVRGWIPAVFPHSYDITTFEIEEALRAARPRLTFPVRLPPTRPEYVTYTTTPRRRPISRHLRYKILQRDEFTCQSCRRSAELDGVALEVDHMQPVRHGGQNDEANLWTLCRDCNQGKGARLT